MARPPKSSKSAPKYPMPPKKPREIVPQPSGAATPEDIEAFAKLLEEAAAQVRSYAERLGEEQTDASVRYLARTALVAQCRVLLDETEAFSRRI